jgi:nucleoporin POM152
VSVPVKVFGKAPLTLTYEILSERSARNEYTIENIEGGDISITTPVLAGGMHSVGLVSISDARGCVTPLQSNYVELEVRRQRPSAAFAPVNAQELRVSVIVGSRASLPLHLSGEGPWMVTYRHTRPDGTELQDTVAVHQANGGAIEVSNVGKYWLVDVRDAHCQGEVLDKRSFEVSFMEIPTIKLADSSYVQRKSATSASRREICEGEEDSIEVALTGKIDVVFRRLVC